MSPSRTRVEWEAPSLVTPDIEKASPITAAAGSPADTSVAIPCSQKPESASQAPTTSSATITPPRE